jgi:hypothetical protein
MFDVHGLEVMTKLCASHGFILSIAPNFVCRKCLLTQGLSFLRYVTSNMSFGQQECIYHWPHDTRALDCWSLLWVLSTRPWSILNQTGGLLPNSICGHGTPSNHYPSPKELANDPVFCQAGNNSNDECHYYSGGYDIIVDERMNWQESITFLVIT